METITSRQYAWLFVADVERESFFFELQTPRNEWMNGVIIFVCSNAKLLHILSNIMSMIMTQFSIYDLFSQIQVTIQGKEKVKQLTRDG